MEVARRPQECHRMVENVLLEESNLQVCLDATASQLLGVRRSLREERDRLEQDPGCVAANHSQVELLPLPAVLLFVDRAAVSVNDKVATHRALLTSVVSPEPESVELRWLSMKEWIWMAEDCGKVCTANFEKSRTPFSMSLLPGNDSSTAQ